MRVQKNFRIDEDLVKKMEEICLEKNMSKTLLIETAILKFVQEEKIGKSPEDKNIKNDMEQLKEKFMTTFNEKYEKKLKFMDFNIQNALNLINTVVVASGINNIVDIYDSRSAAFNESGEAVKNRISRNKQIKDGRR